MAGRSERQRVAETAEFRATRRQIAPRRRAEPGSLVQTASHAFRSLSQVAAVVPCPARSLRRNLCGVGWPGCEGGLGRSDSEANYGKRASAGVLVRCGLLNRASHSGKRASGTCPLRNNSESDPLNFASVLVRVRCGQMIRLGPDPGRASELDLRLPPSPASVPSDLSGARTSEPQIIDAGVVVLSPPLQVGIQHCSAPTGPPGAEACLKRTEQSLNLAAMMRGNANGGKADSSTTGFS